MLLEGFKAGLKARIPESSSRVVVYQGATVHRDVDGGKGVSRLDDKDRKQLGRVVGVELGAELKVAGEQICNCWSVFFLISVLMDGVSLRTRMVVLRFSDKKNAPRE